MSMADRDGWIWFDGKMVPWRNATTHVLTHTLHYGMGVFEGVRCYKTVDGPAIFRLRDHTDRFFNSAHIYQMKMPFSKEQIDEAQLECVRKNGLESCYLRPIAFYGSHAMGVAAKSNPVLVAIAAWPWGAYLGAEAIEKGIRVKTSSYHAPPSERHDVQREGGRQLHGVDPRQPGSAARRIRGSDAARPAGLRVPGLRRERIPGARRQAAHAGPFGRRARRHHAATRSSPSPASSASRSSSGASRATSSTSPTRRSSPEPPPKSRRSASSTTGRSARAPAVR